MEGFVVLALMAKNWWIVAIRGIAAILFGVLTILWPNLTLLGLIYLFGAYALVDGVSSIVAAVRGEPGTRGHGLAIVLIGIIGIAAGIIAFVWPNITALSLLYVVAAWAILMGAAQIYGAYRLRREIDNEWLLALGGVAAIAFGILLVVSPGAGLLSLLALVAAFSIIFGILQLGLAWRLRTLHTQVTTSRSNVSGTASAR
jgi:uncharacterized membrane protein HdeD (DUF308 family)